MLSSDTIRGRAREIGFDLCGVAPATSLPELTRLREWLDKGRAGEMIYLHKSADTRADIRNFLPSTRSVIVTGTVYYTDGGVGPPAEHGGHAGAQPAPLHPRARAKASPLDEQHADNLPPAQDFAGGGGGASAPPSEAPIARYAWGEDYHVVLAERLQTLVDWMRERAGPFESAIFVDKHHVQERVFAKYAGLGWIGKNTCLINPELGSWIFLAGVATSLDLVADTPQPDQCGRCTLCIDSCPTGALVEDYEMDATRCISYLTIELKGAIPEHQRSGIGDHLYGCDVCQDVCPWNLAPLATFDSAWSPRADRVHPNAAELWQRSDQQLNGLIRGSAMTRVSLSRLRRNLAVALGNSGDPAMIDILERPGAGVRRAAPSADTPLVREHIGWAKNTLRGARR